MTMIDMQTAPPSSKPKPRIGVAVLVTDPQGRLLLGRRGKEPNFGAWVIPGGGIEAGESWVVAARRELREETGLIVSVDETRRPYLLEVLTKDEHRLILFVTAKTTGGDLVAGSDLLEARFFERGDFPRDLSPIVRPVLEEFGWCPRAL